MTSKKTSDPIHLTPAQKKALIKQYGHIPSREEVMNHIQASQTKMMNALAKAWDAAPNDPKIKSKLIDLIEKASKLDGKIKEMAKTNQ